jgi:hypothetical protein
MLASLDAGEGRSLARANRVRVMYTIAGTTGLACCARRMAHRIVLFLNAAILGLHVMIADNDVRAFGIRRASAAKMLAAMASPR